VTSQQRIYTETLITDNYLSVSPLVKKHYNVHDQVYEKTPKAPIHCHEAQGPIYKISHDLS